MRRLMTGILAFVAAVLGVAGPLQAQAGATIAGTVQDMARKPIADALITIVGTTLSARTDAQGSYSIKGVTEGTVSIRASAHDMKPFELTGLRVKDGQTIRQDFGLEVMGTPAPPPQGAMLLRFQLLEPTTTRTTDKAIAGIDSVLRGLFQWPGYRMLSQAMITSDIPIEHSSETHQLLDANGASYSLTVSIEKVSGVKVRMRVELTGYVSSTATGSGGKVMQTKSLTTLLSTTVTVTFGHTVVIGTTQTGTSAPVVPGKGTLILTVKPEYKQQL